MLTKADGTGTTHYVWDFENRITSVTLPGATGSVSLKYDPLGRRIQKMFTQNGTTTTAIYAYDGENTIEETEQNSRSCCTT